ncbi:MAG: dihydrodipicolinate synthase family protein [Acidimicrobiales bacterium]
MPKRPKFTAGDISGVQAYPPTPATADAEQVEARSTVDLDGTERMIRQLIGDGVDSIALNGTLGEMATLTLDEWRSFAGTVSETARAIAPDFPVFVGTTTLNTRDTVDRLRFLSDVGIAGTLLGRPMWGELTPEAMVRFYRDVVEACPEMNIVVYDNTAAFRGIIPNSVYAVLAEIPQVVAVKYAGGASVGFRYHNDMATVAGRIHLMPIETDWFPAWEIYGDRARACWSSTTACGPEPVLAIRDAMAEGRREDARWVTERIRWAHETFLVSQNFPEFSKYNVALEKIRVNEAGYIQVGPSRPPYRVDLVPQQHVLGTKEHVRRYREVVDEVRSRWGRQDRTAAAGGS